MSRLLVKIPKDRLGVLIGHKGKEKKIFEDKLLVNLEIDSNSGNIIITLREKVNDPSILFKARDFIRAIGRGFSSKKAFSLIDNDENILEIIDLREIFGKSRLEIKRVKGRIIGKEGKTRKKIEEMTETKISIYGHTIAIIGDFDRISISKEAIKLLIKGSQHSTVYKFLQNKRFELKKKKLILWKDSLLFPEKF